MDQDHLGHSSSLTSSSSSSSRKRCYSDSKGYLTIVAMSGSCVLFKTIEASLRQLSPAFKYDLAQALLCCYYIILCYRNKYGGIREYMLYFDIYFGTECFLNSCTGVILFSGMQKFRVPKEELAENPTCHCITKFVDEPLESLRLFIAWAVVAAVLCFCGSVTLACVLKWGDIPSYNLKDDNVLRKHEKLKDTSIFSYVVFYFIYAVFKGLTSRYVWSFRIWHYAVGLGLVLIVLCKFYCHHLRKVKNGQPLYTPYDQRPHRDHHRVFAPSQRGERSAPGGSRYPAAATSADTSVAPMKRPASSLVPREE